MSKFAIMALHLEQLAFSLIVILTICSLPCVNSKAIRCQYPNNIENAKFEFTGHKINDTLRYDCLKGFWYNGTNPRICTLAGVWSGQAGYCEAGPECAALDPPRHGGVRTRGPPNMQRPLVHVTCRLGYIYKGTSPYMLCVGNNTWNATLGECIEKGRDRCGELWPQEHLMMDYERFADQETVLLYCQDGFVYNGSETMRCEEDGSWTGLNGSCINGFKERKDKTGLIIGILLTSSIIITVTITAFLIVRKRRSPSTRIKGLEAFQLLEPRNKLIVLDSLIDPVKIALHRVIGKGHFGEVYHGTMGEKPNEGGQKVALKSLKVGHNRNADELNQFISEATVMKGFEHPNILPMIGISFLISRLYVILPYMEKGDLKTFLQKNPFMMDRAMRFVYDILKGMSYLASKRFVHRDLAARNCMVDASEHVVIGDFGLARDIYSIDYYRPVHRDKPLPIKWMAVESLETGLFTAFSDIWSFGVVGWEIFSKPGIPYPHVSIGQMKSYLRTGGRLDRPDDCPPVLFAMFENCWQADPKCRPPIQVLVSKVEYLIQNPDQLTMVTSGPGTAPSASTAGPTPSTSTAGPTPSTSTAGPTPSTSTAGTLPPPWPCVVVSGYANLPIHDDSDDSSSDQDDDSINSTSVKSESGSADTANTTSENESLHSQGHMLAESSRDIPSTKTEADTNNAGSGTQEERGQDIRTHDQEKTRAAVPRPKTKKISAAQKSKPEKTRFNLPWARKKNIGSSALSSKPKDPSPFDVTENPENVPTTKPEGATASIQQDGACSDISFLSPELQALDAGYFTPLDLDRLEREEREKHPAAETKEAEDASYKGTETSDNELSLTLDPVPSEDMSFKHQDKPVMEEERDSLKLDVAKAEIHAPNEQPKQPYRLVQIKKGTGFGLTTIRDQSPQEPSAKPKKPTRPLTKAKKYQITPRPKRKRDAIPVDPNVQSKTEESLHETRSTTDDKPYVLPSQARQSFAQNNKATQQNLGVVHYIQSTPLQLSMDEPTVGPSVSESENLEMSQLNPEDNLKQGEENCQDTDQGKNELKDDGKDEMLKE